MRVLLADADVESMEIVKNCLVDLGHDVELAADALACSFAMREFEPEIIVLNRDLLWGGSDGILAIINETHPRSQLSIILTAAGKLSPGVQAAVSQMPNAFLAKPYTLDTLLNLIHKTVNYRASHSAKLSHAHRDPLPAHSIQACPVCGRPLRVSLQLVGKWAMCQHCRATFHVCSLDWLSSPDDPRTSRMRRVDNILSHLQHSREQQ